MISIIPIREKPKFIVITRFGNDYFHYHLNDLTTTNKYCDIGFWRIIYKVAPT